MDPAGQVTGSRARFALTFVALIITVLTACGRSSQVTSPPEPVPTPVVAEPVASTIEEARRIAESGDTGKYQRSLRALALSKDPSVARRAQTLLALDLFTRKQYDEAVPALETAVASNPIIAPYLRLRLIEAN